MSVFTGGEIISVIRRSGLGEDLAIYELIVAESNGVWVVDTGARYDESAKIIEPEATGARGLHLFIPWLTVCAIRIIERPRLGEQSKTLSVWKGILYHERKDKRD